MTYGHGDDAYHYSGKIKLNFSSNIFQGIDHSALAQHLATLTQCLTSYPEPAPGSIENLIADSIGIDHDCVIVTNGTTDAMYLIAHMHQGSRSSIIQPTFSEYADACSLNGHAISNISALTDIGNDCEIAWICNPNNPTGQVIDQKALLDCIDSHTRTLFVIDQAYHLYTHRDLLSPTDAATRRNLIILHSLTKDFCIPGLRIGYAVSNKSIIHSIKRFRTPWSVNHMAIKAVEYLMRNARNMLFDRDVLLCEAKRLACAMEAFGIVVTASDTNYLLCQLPHGEASDLKEYLASEHGILIRDASNFHGLSPAHFRIAAQRAEQNDLLISAIAQWMQL